VQYEPRGGRVPAEIADAYRRAVGETEGGRHA